MIDRRLIHKSYDVFLAPSPAFILLPLSQHLSFFTGLNTILSISDVASRLSSERELLDISNLVYRPLSTISRGATSRNPVMTSVYQSRIYLRARTVLECIST